MLDPVISMCQLQSQLRRKCSSNVIGAAAEGDAEQVPHKKLKTSSSSSSANTLNGGSCREVILHFLICHSSSLKLLFFTAIQ